MPTSRIRGGLRDVLEGGLLAMRVFFSVGEPSGDLHAANLIRELKKRRPDVDCFGFGGPKMREAGCDLLYPIVDDPIFFFAKAIVQVPKYLRLLANAEKLWQTRRPDVVVPVDYPGFNWHVARAAKKQSIPVAYHLPPQIWSWASWRVEKMRRSVDRIFCSLPFEESWYRERGLDTAEHHGHPFFDDLATRRLNADVVASLTDDRRPLLALLPGSRNNEVKKNTAHMLRAALRLQADTGARVCVAAYKDAHRQRIEASIRQLKIDAEVHVGRTPEIIASSTAAIAVSGSVSLELLYHQKPTAVVYHASPLLYHVIGPALVRVPYLTLVNYFACRKIYPEFIGYRDQSAAIAARVLPWLTDSPERTKTVAFLGELKRLYCNPGATAAVAARLLQMANLAPAPVQLARAG